MIHVILLFHKPYSHHEEDATPPLPAPHWHHFTSNFQNVSQHFGNYLSTAFHNLALPETLKASLTSVLEDQYRPLTAIKQHPSLCFHNVIHRFTV